MSLVSLLLSAELVSAHQTGSGILLTIRWRLSSLQEPFTIKRHSPNRAVCKASVHRKSWLELLPVSLPNLG